MVDEILKWDEQAPRLDALLSQTFSPAAAIDRKDFFLGRNALVRRLIDTANQNGQHAIIYGERGVGKTSLANVLADFLEPYTSESIATAKFNCHRSVSYKEMWDSLFKQIDITVSESWDALRLGEVFDALMKDPRKLILIIDEFDRVEDPDIDALFADIIKALSDFSVDTTLILVGVADDVDDLITEHESINRCLSQIHLPRMSIDELIDIVASGIQRVGMEISKDALSQIGSISLGLPHYAHAFGLASGRSAIDHRRLKVETDDVITAIDTLVHQSQQTILQQFDKATANPRKRNNYFTVLLACALASTNELGYFRAADVRAPYSRIMGRDQNIPTFNRHLHELCGDNRGTVLQRFRSARNYRFRFTDPVMQPYALIRAIERGLLSIDEVTHYNHMQ